MSLRERMFELRTPEEVDAFISQNPTAVIFKAGTCHKTMQGWGNVEYFLRDRDDVPVGIIRVVEQRPASNRVAERTGITHQSPQVILFRDGEARFDLDNWNITRENLAPRLERHLPEASAPTGGAGATHAGLEPYARLLDAYLGGQLSEQQFQWAYLERFKGDSALRSQEEFALIDSLFGNPDDHHIHPGAILALEPMQETPLRERAQALRDKIAAL